MRRKIPLIIDWILTFLYFRGEAWVKMTGKQDKEIRGIPPPLIKIKREGQTKIQKANSFVRKPNFSNLATKSPKWQPWTVPARRTQESVVVPVTIKEPFTSYVVTFLDPAAHTFFYWQWHTHFDNSITLSYHFQMQINVFIVIAILVRNAYAVLFRFIIRSI